MSSEHPIIQFNSDIIYLFLASEPTSYRDQFLRVSAATKAVSSWLTHVSSQTPVSPEIAVISTTEWPELR